MQTVLLKINLQNLALRTAESLPPMQLLEILMMMEDIDLFVVNENQATPVFKSAAGCFQGYHC